MDPAQPSTLAPSPPAPVQPVAPQSTAIERSGPDPARHEAFHRTALEAAAGGAVGALLAHGLAWLGNGSLGDYPFLFTVCVAAASMAMIGAGRGTRPDASKPRDSTSRRARRALIGAGWGLVGGALFSLTVGWPIVAALLLGASMVPVLTPGSGWRSILTAALVASGLTTAGLFVGHVLLDWNPLGAWLALPFASGVAGAAAGLFFGLATAPRYLTPPTDPVVEAFRAALEVNDGEIHAILERSLRIYLALQSEFETRNDSPSVRALGSRSGEAVMRVLRIAEQCRQVEADLAATPVDQLDNRIRDLEDRWARSRDPAAQETYRDAIASLVAQKEAIDRIGLGRERIVARLHANVAILEKLRFSLIHLRSAEVERVGGESSPVVEALDELGRELDATASAVGEVFGASVPAWALAAPSEQPTARALAPSAAPTPDTRASEGEADQTRRSGSETLTD